MRDETRSGSTRAKANSELPASGLPLPAALKRRTGLLQQFDFFHRRFAAEDGVAVGDAAEAGDQLAVAQRIVVGAVAGFVLHPAGAEAGPGAHAQRQWGPLRRPAPGPSRNGRRQAGQPLQRAAASLNAAGSRVLRPGPAIAG